MRKIIAGIIIGLILIGPVYAEKTIEFTMSDADAIRIQNAIANLKPIPQVNNGTEEIPVWEDQYTKAAYRITG